jgi:hypothetical protein
MAWMAIAIEGQRKRSEMSSRAVTLAPGCFVRSTYQVVDQWSVRAWEAGSGGLQPAPDCRCKAPPFHHFATEWVFNSLGKLEPSMPTPAGRSVQLNYYLPNITSRGRVSCISPKQTIYEVHLGMSQDPLSPLSKRKSYWPQGWYRPPIQQW